MYLLRDAQKSDSKQFQALASVLNSVNLPNEERSLAEILDHSCRSFQGRIRDPLGRMYVFVLEAPGGELCGTSMLIAQHGTRESPCTFFDVSTRERYSSTLDRHFRHQVLSIGYHYDGPTEIGGLVVHPAARASPDRPGKQLSFVRFLYLAMFRDRFRDTVLAELMPPLTPEGKSLFWESLGKRFTGLEYQEADKASRENKEFIQQLFPPGDLYATLLPPRVQRQLGAVGAATEPVRRMLEAIGFRYVNRIDPFDGGPHYEARTDEIGPVRAFRRGRVAAEPLRPAPLERPKLVGLARPEGKWRFRAVRAPARFDGDEVLLTPEARERLGVTTGDRVGVIPLE
ncbi:arginine N-succinyltransferase [Anaeromyxobacter paludicola]|uniref:Arginine N-succinyltransferase n=1 Tax=Anaeromyxobacter paludicola TaxID=2918171 RepID=A0ABM7XCJ2_9BACT|nr:arginine N-succinyltransferase [Anaeromyxobacter paludicola]BDG09559.1 arginine N-succinyltransferase [Anaeromyxobacter paludicola]